MNYKSTRDSNNIVTPSQAILEGLASDGGLYVPVEFPKFTFDWQEISQLSYQALAQLILAPFLSNFSEEQLETSINNAYDDKFDTDTIAPLVKVGEAYHLELFHGATIAFKDMALSLLPHLMKEAASINNVSNDIVILTATSGDTGKAAMAGFSDVAGTKIIVFYPEGGVSSIQEQQMLTQTGDNTYVASIIGNFDDAQTKVKELFNDKNLRQELADKGAQFSSANSMNVGRLVPQIVYYFYAYAQLVAQGAIQPGEEVNFSVPTGNFGNILAGYYAKRSGLPINKLICASNENKVLFDFFQTGHYDKNRDFILTLSPSMDILVSSNLERLIYHAVDEDSETLMALMDELQINGKYQLDSSQKVHFEDFLAAFADDRETQKEINSIYQATSYLMDPHTAVASRAWRKLADAEEISVDSHPIVVVSTASPYKFPEAVLSALEHDTNSMNNHELLSTLKDITKIPYPPAVDGLLEAERLHDTVIEVDQMRSLVKKYATE